MFLCNSHVTLMGTMETSTLNELYPVLDMLCSLRIFYWILLFYSIIKLISLYLDFKIELVDTCCDDGDLACHFKELDDNVKYRNRLKVCIFIQLLLVLFCECVKRGVLV